MLHGCVLSAALFAIFKHEAPTSNTILKFANDTTMVGIILDNESYYKYTVLTSGIQIIIWFKNRKIQRGYSGLQVRRNTVSIDHEWGGSGKGGTPLSSWVSTSLRTWHDQWTQSAWWSEPKRLILLKMLKQADQPPQLIRKLYQSVTALFQSFHARWLTGSHWLIHFTWAGRWAAGYLSYSHQ